MIQRKKLSVLLIVLLIFSSIIFTGCNDSIEVNERAFVQLIGVDEDEDSFNISLQIFQSQGSSSEIDPSEYNVITLKGKGKTLISALSDAEQQSSKKLFLGHSKAIILGKNNKKFDEELDFFLNYNRVLPAIDILISDSEASKIIDTKLSEGIISSDALHNLLKKSESISLIKRVSLLEFFEGVKGISKTIALPTIKAVNNDGDESLEFSGTSIIKDSKYVGTLSLDETKALNCLLNNAHSFTQTVSCDTGNYGVYITSSSCKTSADIVDGKIVINANIMIKGNIPEKLNRGSNDNLSEIESCFKEQFSKNLNSTIQKSLYNYKADTLKIEKLVRKYNYKFYNSNKDNWDELVLNPKINISYNIELINSGVTIN